MTHTFGGSARFDKHWTSRQRRWVWSVGGGGEAGKNGDNDEGPDWITSDIFDDAVAKAAAHHEIYLSDARKVEAAKLRTILRQPVTAP